MKKAAVLLCLIVLLFSLSAIGVEVHAAVTFAAPELLGRPTATSITVNVVPSANGQVYFQYGTAKGVYAGQTDTATLTSGTPSDVVISGLTPDTQYYYRMASSSDGSIWTYGTERSFHTQRALGSTFTFTIISDSHMNGGGGNVALYQQTLNNVLADHPDFHLDLGDTFWVDGVTSATVANQRYLAQRQYLGTISQSVPIFVSTGNHENEEGWNFDDTNSKALLSVNARKLYYPNPVTDGFHSGNDDNTLAAISGDHLREDYYAWEWGDALFVVIDPFQYTMVKPYAGSPGGEDNDETVIGDRWSWTLGQQQFNWFKQTLEDSHATFKFVFAHHMVGGSVDYVRGGAGPANLFEWGGYNVDGTTWGWDKKRTGWGDDPIHQLMVKYGVTAFFHGHDHEYAYEERDGIVYQLCPMPGDSSYGYGFNLYHESDPYTIRVLPNSGHLRVTVSPSAVTVAYVRAYLPGRGTNGQIAYSYIINKAGSGNNPPVANTQSVTTNEDTAKTITLTATDTDDNPLTYSIVVSPTHGSLSGTAPNLTYTPASNYNGPDSFTFKANDGVANSNIATVSITVTAVNDPPVANAQSVTTNEDTAKAITLTANNVDGDPLTYSIVASPTHGSLSGTAPNLTYTPAPNYNGPDSFTFKANDGVADSNIATVSITVTAVNDPPVAPSNLTATAASTAQINLTWQDNSNDETGFKIERKMGASGTYTQIATTNTNIATYSNTGLSSSTTYYYRVRAYNANGNSAYSNEASATTQSPAPSSNLALNKPATADSEEASLGNTASKGNDGNLSTCWCANDGRLNHWWKVDLGSSYTLTGTKVRFEFARNYRYKIEVSTDNINWTIVANRTTTTSTAQTRQDSFSATPGRFVRITYTGLPRYPSTWASHYEFEVYGN